MLPSFFFFSSRRRHTRYWRDWSSDVCSSDLRPDSAGSGRRFARQRDSESDGKSDIGRIAHLYVFKRFHHSRGLSAAFRRYHAFKRKRRLCIRKHSYSHSPACFPFRMEEGTMEAEISTGCFVLSKRTTKSCAPKRSGRRDRKSVV